MIYDNPEARAGAAPEFDEHEDQYFTVKCLRGPFSDNLLIALRADQTTGNGG